MLPVLQSCHNYLRCNIAHQGMSLFSQSARRASLFNDLRIGWITGSHFLFKQRERQKEWGTEWEAGADRRRGRGVTKCERETSKLPVGSPCNMSWDIFVLQINQKEDPRQADIPAVFFRDIYIFVRRPLYCFSEKNSASSTVFCGPLLCLLRGISLYTTFARWAIDVVVHF